MDEIINGSKFISFAEKVFSAKVSSEQFEFLNRYGNLKIIMKYPYENDAVWFYDNKLKVRDGDIIYCQTEALELLFSKLLHTDVRNLTLISHQSDRKVNKKLWRKKPNNINKWFSTNVVFESDDLVGIPLGVRNDYTENYDLESFIGGNSTREDLLFINFRINTNFKERNYAFKHLKKVVTPKMNIPQNNFFRQILKSKFLSAPWGNGFDTHRLWESLYLGCIPITRNHFSYKNFNDLPILFVNSWEKINRNFLTEKYEDLIFQPENIKKLKFSYWENLILNEKISPKNTKLTYLLDGDITKDITKHNKRVRYRSYVKKITTFRYKYGSLSNYIKVFKRYSI